MLACQLILWWRSCAIARSRSFGACLAVFSGVLFLVSDWRTQRAIARLNFAAPSVAFLRSAIARLEAQRNPFHTREFYIAMGGFWVGCNLMFAAAGPCAALSLSRIALPP